MLKTLNVTDSDWTVPYPHLGSIGKQLPFEESCTVAAAGQSVTVPAFHGRVQISWLPLITFDLRLCPAGFDAVNLDVDFAQVQFFAQFFLTHPSAH